MIKIIYDREPVKTTRLKAREVMKMATAEGQQAFVGSVGTGGDGVYIVSFDRIFSASTPWNSWGGGATVVVERWVDLEVTVK